MLTKDGRTGLDAEIPLPEPTQAQFCPGCALSGALSFDAGGCLVKTPSS